MSCGHEPETLPKRPGGQLLRIANAIAIVHGLVGVEPEAIESDSCLEVIQVTLPPRTGLILEEIGENNVMRPCLANEVWTVQVRLNENIFIDTSVVNIVAASPSQ